MLIIRFSFYISFFPLLFWRCDANLLVAVVRKITTNTTWRCWTRWSCLPGKNYIMQFLIFCWYHFFPSSTESTSPVFYFYWNSFPHDICSVENIIWKNKFCKSYRRNPSNTLFWTHSLLLAETYWKSQIFVCPTPYLVTLLIL